jgi:hypothetical protein
VCFFSFRLSDVPAERAACFWEKVKRAVIPEGRVYLLDTARSDRASARDDTLQDPGEEVMLRRLTDGRDYHIVKQWFSADALGAQLARLGRSAQIQTMREFFVCGHATPSA